MSRYLSVALLLSALAWGPALPAVEEVQQAPVAEQTVDSAQDTQAVEEDGGWSGLTIALIVFFIAFAYIISTATALNRMGGKGRSMPRSPPRQSSTARQRPEGRGRFRL